MEQSAGCMAGPGRGRRDVTGRLGGLERVGGRFCG